ncbi:LAME_0H07448g1_1 [Lachancea meyersii CBS 8951]|uniref:LAME_0H07448g1_1 n=1 Tax=Lachancea meyersii CBS 8951 TaxID=1266667 RepID=A0A1G4KF02_9SACH|nr:LAME_0H07448g1_1 [Lachancea meyersii CBS 8951]
MAYIADVRLKASTFVIVRQTLQELGAQYGCHGQTTLANALTKAIENKLRKMTLDLDSNSAIFLTSKNFLLEGQGSIEISLDPTEAQISIVRSLIKVVLHQIGSKGHYNLTDGQENLLVSLCVESLQVEAAVPDTVFCDSQMSMAEEIMQVFNGNGTSSPKGFLDTEKAPRQTRKSFKVKYYCCLEDCTAESDSTGITEEFDRIDIHDTSTNSCDDESTLVAIHPTLSDVSISAETLAQSKIQLLPSAEFEGLWESLHFDGNIKQKLFSYATISLKLSNFSQQKLSHTLVSNNKLLLVHGPPGTGKTTVCKALCQKLAIRHSGKTHKVFQTNECQAIIVELSCSQIFSRWFGESAKNLGRIFQDVENLLLNESHKNRFVCLLMDEIETLAPSRSSLMGKNEATDGIRVVNTLLTKLDSLKRYHNLLILATSNLLSALDPAFVDRADSVFYVGSPSEIGTSLILTSTINELIKTGVIVSSMSCSVLETEEMRTSISQIARQCVLSGISGRTLRKLPLNCLSEHLSSLPVTLRDFTLALALTVQRRVTLETQDVS